MKLIVNNIGKIHDETTICLDGITVLAGDNGSGKSTISKALFCLYRGFYNIDQKVYCDRKREIARLIEKYRIVRDSLQRGRGVPGGLIDQIIDDYAETKNSQKIADRMKAAKIQFNEELPSDQIAKEIEQVLRIPDHDICGRLLLWTLQEKFGDNIANVNFPEEDASVRLNLKNGTVSVSLAPDGTLSYLRDMHLMRDVIAVDDFFSEEYLFGRSGLYSSYRWPEARADTDQEADVSTVTGRILQEQKAESILSLLTGAGIGEMRRNEENRWVYTDGKLKKPIGTQNISSGTKAFLTLKYLIMNDQIDQKAVCIFEEPEVHLHPKWQELYAEIIILLQKTYDLTVLVSTHSTDFVSFLEYYARKHDRTEYCHYYFMHNDASNLYATAEDVTGNPDIIYKELGLPYIRVSEELAGEKDS